MERQVGVVLHVTRYLVFRQAKRFQAPFRAPRTRLGNCPGSVIPSYVPMEVQVSAVVARWDEERLTNLHDPVLSSQSRKFRRT